ncbi:hypothetical protein SAMN05421813_11736 [Daejeonella rubra]|uniref:Uncharacterized protein n=1 Tax=Daejeonella rubra TaxID=990371 RepID=A0A1G9UQT7_9SPHI|nr:hypothetical protein SAMN05421813_11736 [Daejeonella rubra]
MLIQTIFKRNFSIIILFDVEAVLNCIELEDYIKLSLNY